MESFRRLLQFPFIGISHPERAFLAVAIMARYGGSVDETVREMTRGLLSPSQLRRAEILGRVLVLGHRFSASVPKILDQARIRLESNAVRLEILSSQRIPDSDAVQARLRQLARVSEVEGAEIVQMATP
jgi:exopolyphosphatase/guanosine-5'-triphosphate,3'-diphosphate pyrophosphatase